MYSNIRGNVSKNTCVQLTMTLFLFQSEIISIIKKINAQEFRIQYLVNQDKNISGYAVNRISVALLVLAVEKARSKFQSGRDPAFCSGFPSRLEIINCNSLGPVHANCIYASVFFGSISFSISLVLYTSRDQY